MILLGEIDVAPGTAENNLTTVVPFAIPPGVKALRFQPDGNSGLFEIGAGDTFLTTLARGAALPGPGILTDEYEIGGLFAVASVYAAGAGILRVNVYGVPK